MSRYSRHYSMPELTVARDIPPKSRNQPAKHPVPLNKSTMPPASFEKGKYDTIETAYFHNRGTLNTIQQQYEVASDTAMVTPSSVRLAVGRILANDDDQLGEPDEDGTCYAASLYEP